MRSSVIVVAYNSRTYLPGCIESILPQLQAQDELIVVDNGSTDGSADLVRTRYPQVHLLCGENRGYAGGNNYGAAQAQGKYLVFLNPDTIVRQGVLAALVEPLEQQDDNAMTTACIVHMKQPDIVNTCGNIVHYTGLTYCRGAGQPVVDYQTSVEVDAVSGAAFAIRREIFEKLGGFDEKFFMYVEDTDLSWRARMIGYHCLYVSTAIVEHDYHLSYTPTKAFYLDRNRHLMLLKNVERATYIRMVPGLLLAEIMTWGFMLLKGPRFWGVKPRVYGWLWNNRQAIYAMRQRIHATSQHRDIVIQLTHRLEFNQLANTITSHVAAALFHPAFRLAQRLFIGG